MSSIKNSFSFSFFADILILVLLPSISTRKRKLFCSKVWHQLKNELKFSCLLSKFWRLVKKFQLELIRQNIDSKKFLTSKQSTHGQSFFFLPRPKFWTCMGPLSIWVLLEVFGIAPNVSHRQFGVRINFTAYVSRASSIEERSSRAEVSLINKSYVNCEMRKARYCYYGICKLMRRNGTVTLYRKVTLLPI